MSDPALAPVVVTPSRVLIVDDEAANRELLEIILGLEGFSLDTAASGEEALASAARSLPDLVLLDLMMPGMTGYEVISRMKANGATAHIPIIIITAMSDRASRERALAAGAVDVLTKPTERCELCARIRTVLRFGTPSGPPVLLLEPGSSVAADVQLATQDSCVYNAASGRTPETGGSVATSNDAHVRAAAELLRAHAVADGGAVQESATAEARVEESAAAAARLYVALFKELAPMLGESGVLALFARAVKLTAAEFPCLQEVQLTDDTRHNTAHLKTQMVACLSRQQPAAAIATALYATFLRLLASFIGDELVRQILNQLFAARYELASREKSQ